MRHYRLLMALTASLLLLLAACVGSTSVVFENQTVCGTIQIELTNSQTNVTETYGVEMGETLTIDVAPNVTYRYVVDYTAAGETEDGLRCVAIQRGQVTVPAGSSTKFNLTAVTPTPSPSDTP